MDPGCGGDNLSCKTCKALVKTPLPINRRPTFNDISATVTITETKYFDCFNGN